MKLDNGLEVQWDPTGIKGEGFLWTSRKRWWGLWFEEGCVYRSQQGQWFLICGEELGPARYLDDIVKQWKRNGH